MHGYLCWLLSVVSMSLVWYRPVMYVDYWSVVSMSLTCYITVIYVDYWSFVSLCLTLKPYKEWFLIENKQHYIEIACHPVLISIHCLYNI